MQPWLTLISNRLRVMSRVDILTGRLERTLERLESFPDMPMTRRTERWIERLERRAERLENRIEYLRGDEFEITFQQADDSWSWDRFEVNVHDSSYDDTFTGNDPLLIQFQGTRTLDNGRRRTVTTRSTFVNGDYWDGENEQVLIAGGNLGRFADFDQLTVTIATDTGDRPMGFEADDILAVQTFNPTDLFG